MDVHRRGNRTYLEKPSSYLTTEHSPGKSDHPNLQRLSICLPINLVSSHQSKSLDNIPQSPSPRKMDEPFLTERCRSPQEQNNHHFPSNQRTSFNVHKGTGPKDPLHDPKTSCMLQVICEAPPLPTKLISNHSEPSKTGAFDPTSTSMEN